MIPNDFAVEDESVDVGGEVDGDVLDFVEDEVRS